MRSHGGDCDQIAGLYALESPVFAQNSDKARLPGILTYERVSVCAWAEGGASGSGFFDF